MKNKTTTRAALILAAGLTWGIPAHADEWDLGDDTDNGGATDNVLFHGSEQAHDLAALSLGQADQDWYLLQNRQYSSYQVVIDGQTGDLDLAAADVQRLDVTGTTVLQNAVVTDFGGNLTLNWRNGAVTAPANYVRVQGAACGTACDATDRYRVRFYDTTYTIPRFNNSGTQTTVLLIQNATDQACNVYANFFSGSGALLSVSAITVPPSALFIVPTAGNPSLVGQSGSVRVAHDCGYGGLSGKAVSIEPATGFTFDTAMLHRPH